MSSHPASPPEWTTVDRVAEASEPPAEYARWLVQPSDASDDYLFAEPKVRFVARDSDRLVAPEDLQVMAEPAGVVLSSKRLGGSLRVQGLSERVAQRLCSSIDGQRTCAELARRAFVDAAQFDVLLRATLGRVLFVPEALSELEQRVSGTELVRFVGTPYEIERAYWNNMADVRERTPLALAEARDAMSFVRALRRLHVVALLGNDQKSFYRPASRISGRSVTPGALYDSPVASEETLDGTLLLSGPRVGVPFVGGRRYHELVCAHDPEALENSRRVYDANGLEWGRVVLGRTPNEADNRSWFLPPRPLSQPHFESLYSAYDEARSTLADRAALVRSLARFHFRFVRLHPFRCANQSLCMNLVNHLLSQGTGAMPHSLLDQFALRLSEAAYETVFARAVAHTSGSGAPAARWAELRRQKNDVYSLVARLQNAASLEAARALSQASPSAAEAALISD